VEPLTQGLHSTFHGGFWAQNSIGSLIASVFEDALDAMVVVDTHGTVLFLNRAYEVILGVMRAEALGRHITEVIPGSRMHIVAQSGIAEIGRPFEVGPNKFIVERHPVFVGGELVGAVGRVMFRKVEELKNMVDRVESLQRQVEYYERQFNTEAKARYRLDDMIGSGPAMTALKAVARRAAQSNATALILGESGTGKELLSHAMHSESRRAQYPFVKVNCAAIPKDLLEAELFGYEAGSFSGALKSGKPGKFELAHRGTIFLDEIGDMPMEMQAKVLRALQEREIQKVGGTKDIKVDVRIVAATNKDLMKEVAAGRFREDLYYRLNVIELMMPPLRERLEDLPVLIRSLMARVCSEAAIEVKVLTPAALQAMQHYHWPGNVRELVHTLERMVNIIDADVIDWADLPPYVLRGKPQVAAPVIPAEEAPAGAPMRAKVNEAEREMILDALRAVNGNKLQAAKRLGIHRSVLYRKMARWAIDG
jgi:transcriptional regulator with PAS, ATPase and Fis domain